MGGRGAVYVVFRWGEDERMQRRAKCGREKERQQEEEVV